MKIDIQAAIAELFGVCMDVTDTKRYEAHMAYAGNTSGVYVRVMEGEAALFSEHVYINGLMGDGDPEAADKIRAMTDRVAEFLIEEEAA
jgi:hypothetical protein